jgi:hypothetical protein
MPQLDLLILQSQLNFLIVFFFGYLFFLKYFLPLVSFFLKVKYKLIVSNLNWVRENEKNFVFYKRSLLISMIKLTNLLNLIKFFKSNRFVFSNLYNYDFIYVRKNLV